MSTKAKTTQAIRVWIVIYPSITLFNVLFGSHLANLPLLMKTLVLTVVLVPWMVFVGLPLVTKIEQKISQYGKPQ